MRILVTGSRDWPYKGQLHRTLLSVVQVGDEVTLVTGACPTGADKMAAEIAEMYGWTVEEHPADWKRYGAAAGPIRNKEMVDLGADVCVAFMLNESKGTRYTATLAEDSGIKTILVKRTWDD